MENETTFARQLDLCPPDRLAFPITLIGAGAIGSAVALTLAKMGCTDITVFDHDILEEHNIPNQICRPDKIGMKKTEALAGLIDDLCGVKITSRGVKYVGQRLSKLVIVAVDSIEARGRIWVSVVKMKRSVDLLIDCRMGAEVGRVFAVRPYDFDAASDYADTLHPAEESERLPCSARSIIYCPSALSAIVASLIKRYAMNERFPGEVLIDMANMSVFAP